MACFLLTRVCQSSRLTVRVVMNGESRFFGREGAEAMFTRVLIAVSSLVFVPVARAGAVITLVPEHPGPYWGCETIEVEFFLSQDTGSDIALRMLQFDMNATDPAVGLDSFEFVFDETQELCRIMPSSTRISQ